MPIWLEYNLAQVSSITITSTTIVRWKELLLKRLLHIQVGKVLFVYKWYELSY